MRLTKDQIEERERLAELGLKQCSVRSGCGEIKSVDDFGPNKVTWDNKHSICRICNRNKSNKYNQENREARKASSRQYYLDNPEAKRQYNRTYSEKRKQDDPMYARLKEGRLRAEKAGGEWQRISTTDLLSYWKLRDITIDTCYYCKQSIGEDELEFDHGIPIGRGGGHTLDNLFPCHKSCNQSKGKRTAEEYLMQVV